MVVKGFYFILKSFNNDAIKITKIIEQAITCREKRGNNPRLSIHSFSADEGAATLELCRKHLQKIALIKFTFKRL